MKDYKETLDDLEFDIKLGLDTFFNDDAVGNSFILLEKVFNYLKILRKRIEKGNSL